MSDLEPRDDSTGILILTSEIVAAYAGRNQMATADLPTLIRSVHATLSGITGSDQAVEPDDHAVAQTLTPAVPIDASVGKDAVICLECGKGFKTLKRHLSTEHDLSPADYKARWQLSKGYPLVAPSYSAKRAETAKAIGLGRKPGAETAQKPKPKPRAKRAPKTA